MDAESRDQQVDLLEESIAGVLAAPQAAPLGESHLVDLPILLQGQRECGAPQADLAKALGLSSDELRCLKLLAIAKLVGRVGAPTLQHRLDPRYFFLFEKRKAFLRCSSDARNPSLLGLLLQKRFICRIPDVEMLRLLQS